VIAQGPPFRIQILDRPPDGDGIARLGIGRIEEEVITLAGRIANRIKDEGAKLVVFYLSSIDGDLDQVTLSLRPAPQMEDHIVGIFASVGSHEHIYAVKAVIGSNEDLPDGDGTVDLTRRCVSNGLTHWPNGEPLQRSAADKQESEESPYTYKIGKPIHTNP